MWSDGCKANVLISVFLTSISRSQLAQITEGRVGNLLPSFKPTQLPVRAWGFHTLSHFTSKHSGSHVCLIFLCVCSLSCVWLFWDIMNCNLSASSVHGIFQARILEWVAISFSRGSSQHRDRIRISWVSWFCGWVLYQSSHTTLWSPLISDQVPPLLPMIRSKLSTYL